VTDDIQTFVDRLTDFLADCDVKELEEGLKEAQEYWDKEIKEINERKKKV
jgi:phage/plasmid-associated DNA primase